MRNDSRPWNVANVRNHMVINVRNKTVCVTVKETTALSILMVLNRFSSFAREIIFTSS